MKHKVSEIYESGKGSKSIKLKLWDSSDSQLEPLSTNEKTWNGGEPSQELWPKLS